jgi:membrane protease YdiL (CAAX protease family)
LTDPTGPLEPVDRHAGPDADAGSPPGATPPDPVADGSGGEPRPAPAGPPGARTFTIEGRAAPGLYWLGWVLTIVGGGLIGIAVLATTPGFFTVLLLIVGLVVVGLGLVAGAGSQGIERRARGVAGYAGPSPFLVFAASIPWTILLSAAIALPLGGILPEGSEPFVTVLALLATALVYVGLINLLVVDAGALRWSDMGVRRPSSSTIGELFLGGLLAVPVLFVSGLLAAVLSMFLSLPEAVLPSTGDLVGALLNLVAGAVIAPIAEEVFFRGFATTAWARVMEPSRAIVRGAVFFAFVHVLTVGGATFGEGIERAAFAFIVRLPVSLALCWVFLRRGTLSSAIGLHSVYNGIPLLLAPLAPLPG